jgi:hypothetical protein
VITSGSRAGHPHIPSPPWLRPVLLLGGFVLVLFADTVFRGHTFYERDIHSLWFSQTEAFVRNVAAGSWPLWDPFIGFGRPLLANPSAQPLYPWTWLNLVVPPGPAYTFYAASHVLIAGLGVYALARDTSVSRLGSLVAASLWMASGPLLSYVSLWHHLAGAAWLPWVVLALDRAARAPSATSVVTCGVAFGLQLLAGSADMCIATLAVGVPFCLRHAAWRRPLDGGNARLAGAVAAAVVLGIALAAAQWLPTVALALGSTRRGLSETVRAFWSVHPIGLLQMFVPAFPHELPLSTTQRTVLFEGREPFLTSLYLGAVSLPLVCASLGRSSRMAWLLAGMVAAAALVALGRFGVLYPLAAELFPPFRMLRYPVKVMVVAAFGWALLAGLGFDAWRGTELPRSRLLLSALAVLGCALLIATILWLTSAHGRPSLPGLSDDVLAAGAAAFAPARQRLIGVGVLLVAALGIVVARMGSRARADRLAAALALLAVVDLYWSHRRLNPTEPAERILRRPEIATVLPAGARLFVFDYSMVVLGKTYRRPRVDAVPPAADGMTPALRGTLLRLAELSPPSAARWGYHGSYDGDLLSLDPIPLRNLSFYVRATEETPGFLRMMRAGAVQFVVARHAEGLEDLVPFATVPGPSGTLVRVFAVPDPLPRVSLVGRARSVDGFPALRMLVDPTFDPRQEVLLPTPAPEETGPFSGQVVILDVRPDRLQVRTVASREGYLVVSEAYSEGWSATIDGRPAPVLRANVGFRGVRVPGGTHDVALSYWPTGFTAGLSISAISWAAVLASVALLLVRSRRTLPSAAA